MKVVLLLLLLNFLWLTPIKSDEDCVEGEEGCASAHADGESSKALQEAEVQNNVLVLNDENFSEIVKELDMILVTFYAPWCHHCHSAIEVFQEVAVAVAPRGISMGKLDIEANKDVKTRYQIKQVPDARIFKKGVMYPYEGPGDREGVQAIVDFLVKERLKDEEGAVLRLTEDNFDNIVRATPLMLVEFFADWCPPCQALAPHFYGAAKRLLKNHPPITLGQVRVPDQLELAKKHTLSNYPQLFVFRYGKKYEYTGPKDSEEGIVQFMLKQAGPSSTQLSSADEANEFAPSEEEARVIAFLPEGRSLERYKEVGNQLRQFVKLGHCTSEEVARAMGFKMGSVVVYCNKNLASKYEKGYAVISSLPDNEDEITALILDKTRPLVGERNKENEEKLFSERPLLVVYFDISWDKEIKKATSYWHNLVASVAKDYVQQDLTFAISNEADYQDEIKLMGLEDWGEDVSVGIFAPNNIRYPMWEELYPESLLEFVDKFFDNDLKPHLRSEPAPRKSKKPPPIQRVVGSTFSKFMQTPSRASLVKLCQDDAPKCNDAKKHLHEVVIRFEGSKEVIFGEINMAYNDLPVGTALEGEFPIYLFSAMGSKEITQVSPQPSDENDIIFFLKYRSSIRPTVSDRELHRREEKKEREQKKRKKAREEEVKKRKAAKAEAEAAKAESDPKDEL